jgi:hypothetical protein
VATPPAGHRLNGLGNHFGLFDIKFPAHGVVVEGAHRRRLNDIKAGYVSTGRASVSGSHALNGTGSAMHLNHATGSLDAFVD